MFPHTVLRYSSFVSSGESCEVYLIIPFRAPSPLVYLIYSDGDLSGVDMKQFLAQLHILRSMFLSRSSRSFVELLLCDRRAWSGWILPCSPSRLPFFPHWLLCAYGYVCCCVSIWVCVNMQDKTTLDDKNLKL